MSHQADPGLLLAFLMLVGLLVFTGWMLMTQIWPPKSKSKPKYTYAPLPNLKAYRLTKPTVRLCPTHAAERLKAGNVALLDSTRCDVCKTQRRSK